MQSGSLSGGSQLEEYVELLRSKLPVAPEGLINGYVRWAPWVAIVFGAIGVLLLLAATVLTAVLLPFMVLGGASGIHAGGAAFIAAILGLIASVAAVVGGVLMLQRSQTGWWILAAGIVINLLADLLGVSLLTLIVTLLIAYVHIEARPQYH